MQYKILVTHPEVPQDGLDILSSSCEVIICQGLPPPRSQILEKIKGVHGLLWASHEMLNAEVLDAAGPQLKSISTISAGIDNVDVEEIKKRKIPLGHTPTVVNDAVADLAIGLMLGAARRFHEGRLAIDNSQWQSGRYNWLWGQDIKDATVGFFGFGAIGQTIGKRLQGFDIEKILYTTRRPIEAKAERKLKASKVDFDTMLSQSDIVFVAAPLTDETNGVFNSTAFGKMKKTALFINIARGAIVNQQDLYQALKNKQIFAAGLDVVVPEPLPANDPLLSLPNLVITPHFGTATSTTRNAMSTIAAHNILRGLAGEPMFAPVY